MLFATWRHHLRFCSGSAYAPFNAMVTKISKWSRIQDSCQITPQNLITCSLCHAWHTLKISERSIHNFSSYLSDSQTDRQMKTSKNVTSLAEVITSSKFLANVYSKSSIHNIRKLHSRIKAQKWSKGSLSFFFIDWTSQTTPLATYWMANKI